MHNSHKKIGLLYALLYNQRLGQYISNNLVHYLKELTASLTQSNSCWQPMSLNYFAAWCLSSIYHINEQRNNQTFHWEHRSISTNNCRDAFQNPILFVVSSCVPSYSDRPFASYSVSCYMHCLSQSDSPDNTVRWPVPASIRSVVGILQWRNLWHRAQWLEQHKALGQ